MRTEEEVIEELESMRTSIIKYASDKEMFSVTDWQLLAGKIRDLRQELRIIEASK